MCPIASEKNGRIEDIIAENVGVDKEEILGFDFELIFSFCKFSFAVLIDATNILRTVPHRLYKSVDSSLSLIQPYEPLLIYNK